ncbi:hypothetical protein DL93DRAFT_921477 [Clavulina sp. PMI_390]|nr:hypothetical protein DL93DRAFT_921477 [Clavulina sp. PMI_390]
MWNRLAENSEKLARDTPGIQMPTRQSFVCGLPGCTSTAPAALRCVRCKLQCYCSVECQKPDWRRHKKFCKAEKQ